jgi:hypothetical protein
LLDIAELGFWCCEGLFCFVAWAWAVSVLLETLLKLRHHQGTPWAMLELLLLLLSSHFWFGIARFFIAL